LRALDGRARNFDDRDLGVWADPAQDDGISYRINKDGRGRENDDVSGACSDEKHADAAAMGSASEPINPLCV